MAANLVDSASEQPHFAEKSPFATLTRLSQLEGSVTREGAPNAIGTEPEPKTPLGRSFGPIPPSPSMERALKTEPQIVVESS